MYLYVFEHFNPAIMGYITPLLPFHSEIFSCIIESFHELRFTGGTFEAIENIP